MARSTIPRRHVAGWLLAMGFGGGAWAAAPMPAIANDTDGPMPAEVRTFLDAAKRADAITDPLARCLAFPDLPGNTWPTDLARRHCELEHGPRITRGQVEAMLDRGAIAELDALFAADLARHFSATGFSEVIHRDFDDIVADDASDRLTQRWLAAAPASPYALAARGWLLAMQSQLARGTRYAKLTPDDNMRRMSELSTLAVEQFERALAIEPRLLPAWVGLMDVARRDSRADLFDRATHQARALDAMCVRVERQRMFAFEPRWGGAHRGMMALSLEYAPLLEQRPLLALASTLPAFDAAAELREDGKHDKAIELLAPAARQSTDPDVGEDLADSMRILDATKYRWPALVHLLAVGRFDDSRAWANRVRGGLLLDAREPDWAQRYLALAVAQDPGDASGHYLYATSLFQGRRNAESEDEFLLAMKDPELHRRALNDLVRSLAAIRSDKAVKYSEQLVRESPGHPDSWGVRAYALTMRGITDADLARATISALEKFMALTEGTSDPRHRNERVRASRDLEQLRQKLEAAPAR